MRIWGLPEVTPGSTVNRVKFCVVTGALVGTTAPVATYAGPLLQTHAWNAVISCGLKDPSPFPSVESICRRRSRRFAGPSPGNVLSAFKVRFRHAVRLLQSAAP